MKWRAFLIHHTAGADDGDLDLAVIRRWHMEGRGWADIGYHFVVERIGDQHVAVAGRPLNRPGSHEPAVNRSHIGVAFAGNFEVDEPPHGQLVAGARLIVGLADALGLEEIVIEGHRDYKATVCPGRHFDLELLRAMVNGLKQ